MQETWKPNRHGRGGEAAKADECDTTDDAAPESDLFEVLHRRVGCMYISDMRLGPMRERAIAELNRLDKGAYPPSAWSDARAYFMIGEHRGEGAAGSAPDAARGLHRDRGTKGTAPSQKRGAIALWLRRLFRADHPERATKE